MDTSRNPAHFFASFFFLSSFLIHIACHVRCNTRQFQFQYALERVKKHGRARVTRWSRILTRFSVPNLCSFLDFNFKFLEVKQQLLCWLASELDKNRQPLPLQKWISMRFDFKHNSNLKLRNAGNYIVLSVLLGNHDRFKR